MADARTGIMTRRTVLRRLSLSALGIPYIVPASALGKSGALPPSERITIGQIGYGWIGGSHLNALLGRTDVQYVAICDVNAKQRHSFVSQVNERYSQRFAKTTGYRACEAYDDYRQMLTQPDMDAVLIATPDHWHALMAISAARAGKDIYCEKPLTLTIEEATEVCRVVRRYGRVFQTGSQQRSNTFGQFRDACELVRNGRIGKIRSVDVSTGGVPKACDLPAQAQPDDFDWDMWVGQTPWRPYHEKLASMHWRPYREYCGGGFADMGAHHFDIAQWALDMDHTEPVKVLYPGVKEEGKISYEYSNGIVMNHVGGNCLGLTFHGSEGDLYVGRDGFWTKPGALKQALLGGSDIRLYHSNNHHGNWIDCIRSRQRCVADVEIGAHTAIICHMGNIAYQLQQSLQWDPLKKQFIGDEAANRLLGRSMRAPWQI